MGRKRFDNALEVDFLGMGTTVTGLQALGIKQSCTDLFTSDVITSVNGPAAYFRRAGASPSGPTADLGFEVQTKGIKIGMIGNHPV